MYMCVSVSEYESVIVSVRVCVSECVSESV